MTTTPATRTWTPSDRDRMIYKWVKFDGHKQSWVAQQLDLNQSSVSRICERYEVPLRAAALQFPLAHPAIEVVLAGVKSIEHWQDAMAKMRYPIPPEFWQELRRERLIPEAAPTPGSSSALLAH